MTFMRSRFDPSLLGGRRHIMQLTLALMVLTELLHTALIGLVGVQGQQSHWPLPWPRLVVLVGLLLLGHWRSLRLEVWGLLCLAAFTWRALGDINAALLAQALPAGISLWIPVVLLECFLVFGASYGVLLVCLLGVLLVLGFALHAPLSSVLLQGWINVIVGCAMLCVLGYGFSRFLEQVDQDSASSNQALNRARMDALTRVLGRAAAEYELELSCERAHQQQIPLSLIVCDIDHFKKVNDQHGHAKGDDVLRAVAQKLRHNTANIGAKVGRWGGEEFIIIVPRYARNEAVTLAEQIRREIASSPMAGLEITISLGVAVYRRGENPSRLFERADQATYRAKNAGRNTVEA